jgi:uncharacterized membrane protein YukC
MKQGEEQTKFIKDPEEPTRNYIFQKNQKTKIGTYIIVAFLTLMIIGVIVSIYYLESPKI